MHASNSTTGAGATARISIQVCSGTAVHPFRGLSAEYAPARSARFTARRHGFSAASATTARMPLLTWEAWMRSGTSSSLRISATSSTGNPSMDAVSRNAELPALHYPGSSAYMTACHAATSRLSCPPALILPPVSCPVPPTSTAGQTPSPARPIPVSPATASAFFLER